MKELKKSKTITRILYYLLVKPETLRTRILGEVILQRRRGRKRSSSAVLSPPTISSFPGSPPVGGIGRPALHVLVLGLSKQFSVSEHTNFWRSLEVLMAWRMRRGPWGIVYISARLMGLLHLPVWCLTQTRSIELWEKHQGFDSRQLWSQAGAHLLQSQGTLMELLGLCEPQCPHL